MTKSTRPFSSFRVFCTRWSSSAGADFEADEFDFLVTLWNMNRANSDRPGTQVTPPRYPSSYLPEALESVFITDSDIRHIKRKHGNSEESRGQVAIEPSDFGRIPFVLNEFDTCEHTDTDKLGNKKFLLTKSMGDTVYLVTIQRGKRKLEIKTMWKRRSGASC